MRTPNYIDDVKPGMQNASNTILKYYKEVVREGFVFQNENGSVFFNPEGKTPDKINHIRGRLRMMGSMFLNTYYDRDRYFYAHYQGVGDEDYRHTSLLFALWHRFGLPDPAEMRKELEDFFREEYAKR